MEHKQLLLLLVICYTNLCPCSTALSLCCFSVWPQRTQVLTSSNTSPRVSKAELLEAAHPPASVLHFHLPSSNTRWAIGLWTRPTLHQLLLKNGPKMPFRNNRNTLMSRTRTSSGRNTSSPSVNLMVAHLGNDSKATNI